MEDNTRFKGPIAMIRLCVLVVGYVRVYGLKGRMWAVCVAAFTNLWSIYDHILEVPCQLWILLPLPLNKVWSIYDHTWDTSIANYGGTFWLRRHYDCPHHSLPPL